MSVSTPYQFAKRGNLFIIPVGPSIDEVPYPAQSFTKPPPANSLWVNGRIQETGLHHDHARMSTHLYREVRDDLTRYSPVEVTRSAFCRSHHAYVGVIDSRGVPYYFALDSRGVSVRAADSEEAAWKAFDRMSDGEHAEAVRQRRAESAEEVRRSGGTSLVITKGLKYGKKTEWKHNVPHSTWWRKLPKTEARDDQGGDDDHDLADAHTANPKKAKTSQTSRWRAKYPGGKVDKMTTNKSEIPLVVISAVAADAGDRSAGVDPATYAGLKYAALMRRLGADLCEDEDLDPPVPADERFLDVAVVKALPKKPKVDEVKKTPARSASKKQAGAGGKTRYTYLSEKKSGAGNQVPLVIAHDDHKHADPFELANQLGVSVRTLQAAARRLGRSGFATFMRSRLKRFAAKHRLDPDYWNTLYVSLESGDVDVKKSENVDLKKFGDDAKKVASSVPESHVGRFHGSDKVFIHHVHHEMKRRGMYSGGLDEFKNHLVEAQHKRHVNLSRADLVGAMDPKHVSQSETHANGASFHFVNAGHNPHAAKELDHAHAPQSAGHAATDKMKTTRAKPHKSIHHEVAGVLSQEARDATKHATKINTKEAHLAAMTAHHQAGAQHQKASGDVNNKTALKHFDQSVSHLKASKAAN